MNLRRYMVKLYEELMSDEEIRRSWELEQYFAILPAFTALYRNITYTFADILSEAVKIPYNSANETPLDLSQLGQFLKVNGLLYDDPKICAHPAERFWPDDADRN